MTPRDKAIQIRNEFCKAFGLDHIDGQRAARMVVDEILADYQVFNDRNKTYKVPAFWQLVQVHLKDISL